MGTLDHVKAYMTQVNFFSENMVVHYRLFHTTFAGVALEWYYSLSWNSVDSFDTLCGGFLVRLADSKPIIITFASLHNVIQREGEGLVRTVGLKQEGSELFLTFFESL